ncbi:hypothetical protein TNCV_1073931 [Trichonephila clavipes]|uniref:Uncharacterized protein n=1 Tax=Trichonephila clavipes TaxID=2585209 RepID=A0A8X6T3A0_TRICX|nr:hypothetical protein TNCV_1073931 [Trichonephila clavipes]
MPRHRIRAHYEQLSEFGRGRIIELKEGAYQTLFWPARLPDSSAIKHVWDVMGSRLHLPRNVDFLPRQMEQIWHEAPQ